MAKKKDSKVSISTVDKILKAATAPSMVREIKVGETVMEIEVKQMLSLTDFACLVQSASEAVFLLNPDTGLEEYHPEYEATAKANAILIYVANFKPEMDINRVFDLVSNTNLMNEIDMVWSMNQQLDFEDAFRQAVDTKRDMLVAGERTKLMSLSAQLDKAINAFETAMKSFEGVTPEAIQGALTAMSNMTEQRLAEAVVDARDKDFVEKRKAELSVVK